MAEYYVIRNKNTGLYFRGKGENRWGKYYNQASVYRIKKNAENAIKEVAWRGEQAEVVPIQIYDSTADVAPKSQWISIDERLPETNKKVLVCYSNGSMDIAKYIRADGFEFWFEETTFTKHITHWMPLPEPLEGD